MKDGALVREEEPDLSRFIGAGSIVSTTHDLFRFSRALTGDTLLSSASRQMMLTAQNQRYAMGCAIMNPGKDQVAQLFLGGMTGTSAVIVRFNDGQRTIVILANRSKVPTNRIVPQVYRLITAAPRRGEAQTNRLRID